MIRLGSLEAGGVTIAVVAFLTSVLIFLLQWLAKRVLDEAVWPLVKDWWSRRSKASALKRATKICEQFVEDMQIASDYRILHIVLIKESTSSIMFVFSVGIFAAMMISVAIGREGFEESKIFTFSMCFGFIIVAVLTSHSVNKDFKFYAMLLYDDAAYRKKIVKRLCKLLKVSGMSDDEISKWTQAIKDVPSPKTHKDFGSSTVSEASGH